jgi:oligopeptide transport system substrate-binding protein
MHNMKKILAGLLVLIMVLALVACNTQTPEQPEKPAEATEKPVDQPEQPEQTEQPEQPGQPEQPEDDAEYTYHLSMAASPINWNPHAWEMNNESTLMTYIEMPLVDVTIAEDGVNFEWVFEGATGIEDVTATYPDREKWLTPDADGNLPTEKLIYKISLNPDAKWADGTPINADTYIYSMQQMLDSSMKNYRANSYFEGDTAIKNSKLYYNNDKAGQPMYGPANENEAEQYYLNFSESCVFFGGPAKDYHDNAGYQSYFCDAEGNDLYAKYPEAEYVPVTEEVIADLTTMSQTFGDDNPEAWKEWCFAIVGTFEATPWEDVGLIKGDDYTIYYVNETPVSEFYMKSMMTSNWIVYEPLYEAGKETKENLVATNYGTSAETYMSAGPYKLESFEADKQFVLTRNENWYGWTDGKHVGQYQPTKVVYDIIPEHATALMAFIKGDLDEIALTADDLVNYKMSEYLLKTDETYTGRYIFATDLDKLSALEEEANDGKNKKVLFYDDFRKAISLSMNRAQFCADCTSGFKPAYFLLNSLYYYDIENNTESQYRNTKEGRDAVLRLYGVEYGEGKPFADDVEAYASINGYDVEAARALFQKVYEQAIADGNYTDGQLIHIRCEASAAAISAEDTRQQEYLNDFVAEATKGTGFEGKIDFEFLGNISNRYEDVALGKIEMIRGAWGGAAFYPFSTIRVYCEPEYMGGMTKIHESCGWDPTVETITIPINGEERTDTIQNWAKSIQPAGEFGGDEYADMRLHILSYIETAVLGSYQCIPYGTYTDCSLFSKKIQYATEDYNIMYGYGGIRLMKFNYNDAEWAEFVASQNGEIDYK